VVPALSEGMGDARDQVVLGSLPQLLVFGHTRPVRVHENDSRTRIDAEPTLSRRRPASRNASQQAYAIVNA
jgi:hypothetical protein